MSLLAAIRSIRQQEAQAIDLLPEGTLMSRAAMTLADEAESMLGSAGGPAGGKVMVMAGRGNNGCDAMLAGLLLQQRGYQVAVFADTGAPAAQLNASLLDLCARHDIGLQALADLSDHLAHALLVIDGLFGIGQNRPLTGLQHEAVAALNRSDVPVLAVDVPSGIDAETGQVLGDRESLDAEAAGIAVRAERTVTFIADKPGLHTGEALDYVGRVRVDTLGLSPIVLPGHDHDPDQFGELYGRDQALRDLPRRGVNSHKGTFGSLLLAGGSPGMTGALWLAATGAQAAGAGKVYLSSSAATILPDPQAQWMIRPWPDTALPSNTADSPVSHVSDDLESWLAGIHAVVFGCGLGRSPAAANLLAHLWLSPLPLVIDADGLNALATSRLRGEDRPPKAITLLTPHPLEAARLLATRTALIQRDRRSAACAIARRYAAHVILKGAGSVLAAPDGRWGILSAGAPTLATAGSGDVLAGVLGALLAQGVPVWTATRLGAYAHGRAGELAQQQLPLGTGMAAIELFETVRQALNGR